MVANALISDSMYAVLSMNVHIIYVYIYGGIRVVLIFMHMKVNIIFSSLSMYLYISQCIQE